MCAVLSGDARLSDAVDGEEEQVGLLQGAPQGLRRGSVGAP